MAWVLLLFGCVKKTSDNSTLLADSAWRDSSLSALDTSYLDRQMEGILPGLFSVAPGRVVAFSQGNLQFQAATYTFRFAEHQYDIIGAANNKIAKNASAYIDLFAWGTSGWPDTGARSHVPWSVSTKLSDYAFNEQPLFPDDPTPGSCMTGSYANADWGIYNAISNGGDKPGKWRTLTELEWLYLFYGRDHATSLFARAEVCGQKGFLLLPDNWKKTEGLSLNCATDTCSRNNFDARQWSRLEALGAVFLPAAGYRYGHSVRDVGKAGYYNVATGNPQLGTGYHGVLPCTGEEPNYNISQCYGASVRLVHDIPLDSLVRDSITKAQVASYHQGGRLSGKFLVAPHRRVCFSQGNLQFQPQQSRWRFALYQTDVAAYCNSKDILGRTPDYWIDLFNARTTERVQVENGGRLQGTWRALNRSEWEFLLNGRPKAAELRGYARVDNAYGLVLLPDGWKAGVGTPFKAGSLNYRDNVYTYGQWEAMEAAGAVFLPETGYINEADNIFNLANGYYWTATSTQQASSSHCYYMAFTPASVQVEKGVWDPFEAGYDGHLFNYASYRLVTEVK